MNTQHRGARRRLHVHGWVREPWQIRLPRMDKARARRALFRGQREAHKLGLSTEHVIIQEEGGVRWLEAFWLNPDGIELVSLRLFGGAHIMPCDGSEESPW